MSLLGGRKKAMVAEQKHLRAVIVKSHQKSSKVIKDMRKHFDAGFDNSSRVQFYALTQTQLETEDLSFEAETGQNRFYI